MKIFLLSSLVLMLSNCTSYSQKVSTNELSLSTLLVWNHVELTLGNGPLRNKKGNAWSYGYNISYSKVLLKNVFITGGIGLYKQNFGINRPINYDDGSTNLLYSVNRYSYGCLHSLIGIGYNYYLKKKSLLKASFTYNQLNTFQQEYVLSLTPSSSNSNRVSADSKYLFSRSYNIATGIRRFVNNSFSFGVDAILPVYMKWRKDKRFWENPEEFYSPKISAGVNISTSFNF